MNKVKSTDKIQMSKNSYHIVFLGDGGVGKSSITIQFAHNHFVEEYDPTIEDIYRKQFTVDDQVCLIEILDTGGREEFTALRDEFLRKADGIVIVYSITSLSSFEQVDTYIHQLTRVAIAESPKSVIIVGNKIDLESNRQVSPEKGKQLATNHGYHFIESSAKLPKNITEIFDILIRQIQKQIQKQQKASSPPEKSGKCFLQ